MLFRSIPKSVEDFSIYYDGDEKWIGTYYVYKDSSAYQSIINNGYDINYKIINEQTDENTNIQVDSGTCNNIDETTVLKVNHVTSGDDYNIVARSFNQFDMYDIGYYKDNQAVTIDGTATVRIPVGDKDGSKCKVYYYDNGQYTDMNAVYEDGYMVFKTNHFSKYILTEEDLPEVTLGDINEDGEIDFLDAIMILRSDAELIELNEKQRQAADINKDGSIDFLDAIQILRYDAELINSFE